MKNIHFTMLGILISQMLYAEGTIGSANQQLRQIFENISHSNGINFLYDMSCHVIDSAYYSINCPLATDANTWYYLYGEMYNAAFDQHKLLNADSIATLANHYYFDTIPIGIIDWKYLHFPNDILNIDFRKFYTIDEKTNSLLEPYDTSCTLLRTGEVFMASPLQISTQTLNPTFIINHQFLFAEDFITDGKNFECEIDFGDGSGFHHFITNSCITISYETAGDYPIVVTTEQNGIKKFSTSWISVTGEKSTNIPTYSSTDSIPGLRIYRFAPECQPKEDKLIFILAGYNPLSVINYGIRAPERLYTKYIVNGNLEPLRDFGYTFIIVDYVDHNDYIQQNAIRVAQLLSHYRCKMNGDEQFVVIGHSMGCLIGRYALTYLEKYPSAFNDCKIEKMHNTRLFISNDGPHQGVNIPLSIQCLYGSILSNEPATELLLEKLSALSKGYINLSTTLLRGKSVKQMLYYHYASDTYKQGIYYADSLHYKWEKDIINLGDYPQYCKLVALSNGSIEGLKQQSYYHEKVVGDYRYAGDPLIHLKLNLGFTVLGMHFDDKFSLELYTNAPNIQSLGSLNAARTFSFVGLLSGHIYFQSQKNIINLDFPNKTNLQPYCISAAGNEYANAFGININFKPLFIVSEIIPSGIIIAKGNGFFEIQKREGTPWLFNLHSNIEFYSNGIGFGFVPTQSAFDYTRGEDILNYDYTSCSKETLFTHTPFDVIIGRASGIKHNGNEMSGWANFNHEEINNPPVRNRKLEQTTNIPHRYLMLSDSIVRVLAREIGDEELYLNNAYLPYHAVYDAIDLYIQREPLEHNTQNPYYETEHFKGVQIIGEDSVNFKIKGAYAREQPWDCSPYAIPNFYYTNTIIRDNQAFPHNAEATKFLSCAAETKSKNSQKNREPVEIQETTESMHLYTLDGRYIGRFSPNSINLNGLFIAVPIKEQEAVTPQLLIINN